MNESETQQLIMLEAAKYGIILMRNNSGGFKDATGRLIRYGLGQSSSKQNFKSSDLIGIVPPHGRIIAVEVKRSDWKPSLTDKREQGQRNFIEFVKSKGGIAGFCNSVASFKDLLGY